MTNPINNGEVKVKSAHTRANPKVKAQEKPKAQKPATKAQATRGKLDFTTEQLIETIKAVGHAASSREISDKLGIADPDQGRAYVRSRMAGLMKNKKVLAIEPDDKSRATFLYSVAEA